ncbi:polysaccharide biosynthesis protein [Albibacterium bauzanense]|uniref:polysaccharide biosynthesis protein n=1 Tax=Albibacterium bauzanense TaxID=653929 RepID=UPI001C88A5C6|nr:polysaccharide biosynthesis protein [Albibacterium bauzanense]
MGSSGSVIPFFTSKMIYGVLPITNPNMTRFNISLDDSVDSSFDYNEKTIYSLQQSTYN